MTAPAADFPAAMPEFKDAQGLDALLAGGRTRRSTVAATPEAAAAPAGPKWPPPETPEFLKASVRQLDQTASLAFELETDDKLTDSVADQIWPALYVNTNGTERPSNTVLYVIAGVAVVGLGLGKYLQYRLKLREQQQQEAATA